MGCLVFKTSEALTKCLVGSTPTSSAIHLAKSAHDLEAKRQARWLERVEVFLHGRQHHRRVGATLVIL